MTAIEDGSVTGPIDFQAAADVVLAAGVPGGDLQWPPVPTGGVTELRVHGVGGTAPAAMLDVPDPVQVSGDRVAGVWRRRQDADNQGGRVEAYAWGGLNGRGFSAALWLLALPFAMVNLAGWMAPRKDPATPAASTPAQGEPV